MSTTLFFILAVLIASCYAKDKPFCDACQILVRTLENLAINNDTQAQIIKTLQGVCTVLGPYKKECEDQIAEHGEALIQDILNKKGPDFVCGKIHACGNETTTEKPKVHNFVKLHKARFNAIRKTAQSQDGCFVCEQVVAVVEALLERNQTVVKIQNFISKVVCPAIHIPDATCQQYVSQIPALIQQLENDISPEQCCDLLGVCDSARKTLKTKAAAVPCSLCVFVVTEGEDYLAKNATEAQLEKYLNAFCGDLGGFSAQCQAIVDNLPEYIQMLENAQPPQTVCSEIGACNKKQIKKL